MEMKGFHHLIEWMKKVHNCAVMELVWEFKSKLEYMGYIWIHNSEKRELNRSWGSLEYWKFSILLYMLDLLNNVSCSSENRNELFEKFYIFVLDQHFSQLTMIHICLYKLIFMLAGWRQRKKVFVFVLCYWTRSGEKCKGASSNGWKVENCVAEI